MLKNISIDELMPGMYVSKVVEQTGNFRVRSSGLIKTESSVAMLKDKGILVLEVDYGLSKIKTAAAEQEKSAPKAPKRTHSEALNKASTLYKDAVDIQRNFVKTLKSGATSNIAAISELATSIIDSVFDNKDAMSCLTMIKNSDHYLMEHAVNCAILMAMFADHLGYDKEITDQACTGALLMDVGMSAIPETLRHQEDNLSADDWQVLKSHVATGAQMIHQCEAIPELAMLVIEQHHERIDGTGYPLGLKGDDITPFAKMAAIVDSFDAMISNRPHQKGVTAAQALKRLSKQENLDQDLVKHFIRCVGIHPIGSLVKLRSGRLGIISKQGTHSLLSPVVMCFYSISAGSYSEIKRIDLNLVDDEIISGVRPDDFGINLPKFFTDVFIHQTPD